jgi:hypothetical protein
MTYQPSEHGVYSYSYHLIYLALAQVRLDSFVWFLVFEHPGRVDTLFGYSYKNMLYSYMTYNTKVVIIFIIYKYGSVVFFLIKP